jgi:hypothetical protein
MRRRSSAFGLKRYHPPAETISPSKISQSWASVGFIDTKQELEERRIKESSGFSFETYSLDRPLDTPIEGANVSMPLAVVSAGDVFEACSIHSRRDMHHFYVFSSNSQEQIASDKNGNVLSWKVLLDTNQFKQIVFNAQEERKGPEISPERDEIAQYFGQSSKQSFYSMIKNDRRDKSFFPAVAPSHGARISAVEIFLQACREQSLPPVPVLSYCTSKEYPTLDLSNHAIGRAYAPALASAIPAMPFLKRLDLSGNGLDGAGAKMILESVACVAIDSIALDHNRIGKLGVNALCSLITCAPSGSSDGGPHSPSRRRSVVAVPAPLTNGTIVQCTLTSISINDNMLGDFLSVTLVRALCQTNYSHIQRLFLRGNELGTGAATALADLISHKGVDTCRLVELDISWNNVQNVGASLIINAASDSSFLVSLSLDWNGLTDAVLPAIGNCLKNKNALKTINVRNNHLTSDSLATLGPSQRVQINI